MKDRTAMTEPLTTGQRIVAWWETSSTATEPADLADKIDDEIERLREALREIKDWRSNCRDGGIMEWEPVLDWIEARCAKALDADNS